MSATKSKTLRFQWLKFIWLILSKGSLTIKPYDYSAHISALWKANSESNRLNIKQQTPKKSWKQALLFLPIIGPMIGVISQYRLQKKWPSYIFQNTQLKLAFIRISKNAGTSVQAALLKGIYPELDSSKLSVNQINEMGKIHIKPALETNVDCFAIVRNPFDRLLSCYFDQVIGREDRYYFDDYLFQVIKKGMSFEKFVKTIQHIPDELKDIHFRPQCHYLRPIKDVRLFKIESDIDQLCTYLSDFGLKMESQNKNNMDIRKHDYYCEELMHIVREIYQEDFDMFDYDSSKILE